MNVRDLRKLKPGVPVRVKRGWGADGAIVHVVEYPYKGDMSMVKVRDGRDRRVFVVDAVTLVKQEYKLS